MPAGNDRLTGLLQEQVSFLNLSCAAYDQGLRFEAERLATMTRVLVHDTGSSHSLLAQLGIKDTIPGQTGCARRRQRASLAHHIERDSPQLDAQSHEVQSAMLRRSGMS